MHSPGLYLGPHPDCRIVSHHRHPTLTPDGEVAPQPHEYVVTAKAELAIIMSVDLDGTIRIRAADVRVSSSGINDAEIDDRETFRRATLDGDLWDRLLDVVPRDAEVALGEGVDWFTRPVPPILESEDRALAGDR